MFSWLFHPASLVLHLWFLIPGDSGTRTLFDWDGRQRWVFKSEFRDSTTFRAAFRGLPQQTGRPQESFYGDSTWRNCGTRGRKRLGEEHPRAGSLAVAGGEGSKGSGGHHFSWRESPAKDRESTPRHS